MSITIKLFGSLVDAVGKNEIPMQDITDTDSVRKKLIADFPVLENHSFVVAVSKRIVRENKKLNTGDEVALLPPFAGG